MDVNELLKFVATGCSALGVAYWLFVMPERKRRDAVEERLRTLETDMVGVHKDLAQGSDTMRTLKQDVKCLDGKMDRALLELHALKTLMQERGGLPPEA